MYLIYSLNIYFFFQKTWSALYVRAINNPFAFTLRLTEDVSGELLNVFCNLSKFS